MSGDRFIYFSEKNQNGGYYHSGDSYSIEKKLQVIETYLSMWEKEFPKKPSYSAIAREERVCVNTVRKYIAEYHENGFLIDPMEDYVIRANFGRDGYCFRSEFSFEIKQVLLALHVDNPSCPLYSYMDELQSTFGVEKSTTFM